MKVVYGTYEHTDGLAAITEELTTLRDESQLRRGITKRWTISGQIQAAGADNDARVADLTTKIAALVTAYSSDGQDLTLYYGAAETAHKITNASSLGGVRVVSVGWPVGIGAEYARLRSYEIVVEADFEDAALSNLSAWRETVSVIGTGGPVYVWHRPLAGRPVRQQVSEYSTMRLVQTGSATGRTAYPTAPGPKVPGYETEDSRSIDRTGPTRLADGTYRDYTISWHYEMEDESFGAGDSTPAVWGA